MKITQPPITNDQELAGYQAGIEDLRRMIERHENDLLAARQRVPADLAQLDQIPYHLQHLYGYYQGIEKAIAVYLHPAATIRIGRWIKLERHWQMTQVCSIA